MRSCAPSNDSCDRPQALSHDKNAVFAPQRDAKQQKHVDNRKPGHLFQKQMRGYFARGGTLGHRTHTVCNNMFSCLSFCFKWLRDNPKFNGVFGRMSLSAFKKHFEDHLPKSTRRDMIRRLMFAGLITYAHAGPLTFVDFSHWDEPAAHAHYERAKATARKSSKKYRAQQHIRGGNKCAARTPPPSKRAVIPGSEAFYGQSGFTLGASTQSGEADPSPAVSLKKFKETQQKLPPQPVDPQTLEVASVGSSKISLGKEGQATVAWLMGLMPKDLLPDDHIIEPVGQKRAPGVSAAKNKADSTEPILPMSEAYLRVLNQDFSLKLEWDRVKAAGFDSDTLFDAVLYTTRRFRQGGTGWNCLEAVIMHSAAQRKAGRWHGHPKKS